MLSASALTRIICSVIEEHQESLIRKGSLDPSYSIAKHVSHASHIDVHDLNVTETDLGIDSLCRLEIIMHLTRFFGLDRTGVEDYLTYKRSIGEWVEIVQWHLRKEGDSASISFATSGTTGKPKHFEHNVGSLIREVEEEIRLLRQGPVAPKRIISVIANHHIYGFLWTVLLPQLANFELVQIPRMSPMSSIGRAKSGDVVVATPFLWNKLSKTDRQFAADVQGVTSGGPCTKETWQSAKSLGLARFIDIYGSTETAGVGWRETSNAPYVLLGDIQTVDGKLRRQHDAHMSVQDILEWEEERKFRVLGRRDSVVQVGGVNVNLEELRRTFLDRSDAKDVAVRLGTDRLKAFVAVNDSRVDNVRRQVNTVLADLPAPARPASIDYGPDLPRSASGKLVDWV